MDEQVVGRILSERLGITVDDAIRAVTALVESIQIAGAEIEAAMEKVSQEIEAAIIYVGDRMEDLAQEVNAQAEHRDYVAEERATVRRRRPFLERKFRAEIRWAESRRFYRRIYRPPRWVARGSYIKQRRTS